VCSTSRTPAASAARSCSPATTPWSSCPPARSRRAPTRCRWVQRRQRQLVVQRRPERPAHGDPPATAGPSHDRGARRQDAVPAGDTVPFRRLAHGIGVGRLPPNQQVRVKIAGRRGPPARHHRDQRQLHRVGHRQRGLPHGLELCRADPTFSTLNYEANDGVPNQAIVPLDRGDLCLFSSQPTDIIIDVNGYVSPERQPDLHAGDAQAAVRLRPGNRFDPAQGRGPSSKVAGSSPAPAAPPPSPSTSPGCSPITDGWIRAFPCDKPPKFVSSVSARRFQSRANSVIVPPPPTARSASRAT
jgi:hypothetical protein